MAGMDIFADNAFGLVEMSAAIEEIEYRPEWLGTLPMWTRKAIRTETVAIEKRGDTLKLVPTTPRGAPLPQNTPKGRDIRPFRTSRIAKGDRITASEIANIRQFGTESEFVQVQAEVADRMTDIRTDMELTHEHMRLGAIQGIVLDADGSVIYNWFTEWQIAQPAVQTFNFATLINGTLRTKLTQVIRAMTKAGKGLITAQTQFYAMAGDDFYDALIASPEVRATYLGWSAAADLRGAGLPYEEFPFGGFNWVNYRGTDDGSTVAIASNEVKFFPVNAPGLFLRVQGPGEFFDTINQPGQDYFAMTIPDKDRNAFVDVELYSYPLYAVTRPQVLQRGRLS